MSGWPESTEVAELIEALRAATAARDKTTEPQARRAAADAAHRAVLHFLLGNEDIKREHLTRPLADIWAALHDAGRGAAPALHKLDEFDTPKGRPIGLLREYSVGHLAFALELLCVAGRGTALGSAWVAGEAQKAHLFSENGSAIRAEQIVSWRKDIRRNKGAAKAVEQFALLCERYKPLLQPGIQNRADCEKVARNIVQNLSNLVPDAAPASPRRIKNR